MSGILLRETPESWLSKHIDEISLLIIKNGGSPLFTEDTPKRLEFGEALRMRELIMFMSGLIAACGKHYESICIKAIEERCKILRAQGSL